MHMIRKITIHEPTVIKTKEKSLDTMEFSGDKGGTGGSDGVGGDGNEVI